MTHYTLNTFVRQASNSLLAEYFAGRGIDLDLDLKSLKPRKFEPILAVIDQLAEEVQDTVNREFRAIDALANEAGFRHIVDEAHHRGLDLLADLTAQRSFLDKAFWTWLNARDVFDGAAQFAAPFLRGRYWKRGFPVRGAPDVDLGAKVGELEAAVSGFFQREEGRGRACKAVYHRRGPLHQFHAYPEDFPAAPLAWSSLGLAPHPYRPAFEVVFVFRADEQTLDIYFEGAKATVEKLWQVFAKAVLGIEELPPVLKPAYRLDALNAGHFSFQRPPDSPILDVRVQRLGFLVPGAPPSTHFVEANVSKAPDALTATVANTFVRGASLARARVISATLRATIDPRNGKRNRSRTIDLSTKSCSLKHEGADELLRRMLRDSGIDQTGKPTGAGDGTSR
jgi:hypothetical protein